MMTLFEPRDVSPGILHSRLRPSEAPQSCEWCGNLIDVGDLIYWVSDSGLQGCSCVCAVNLRRDWKATVEHVNRLVGRKGAV